jgi:hypothetical protein
MPSAPQLREVGSQFKWLSFRIFQTLLASLLLDAFFVSVLVFREWQVALYGLVLFLFLGLSFWFFYPMASVKADLKGIYFRRWFDEYFAPWVQVAALDHGPFRGSAVSLELRHSVAGSRRVKLFLVNRWSWPARSRVGLPRLERDYEILDWLREQIARSRLEMVREHREEFAGHSILEGL